MLPLVVVNQYVWCCFSMVLPPSGVLKFTGWLPGLFPRPLKVMTMRLYSEKGTSPGTEAWLRSPGNVNVCLSPWLFFKSTRLRRRHQFIWIRRWKNTDINFVSVFLSRNTEQRVAKFLVCVWQCEKENNEMVNTKDRLGWERQTLGGRSGPFLLNCV